MKMRNAILLTLAMLLLSSSVGLAHPGVQPLPTLYTPGQGMASGGRYQLNSMAPAYAQDGIWQISGGGYRLIGPTAPDSLGDGCCCIYMPCVMRDHH